jgi:hypothetical protein
VKGGETHLSWADILWVLEEFPMLYVMVEGVGNA